ARSRRPFRREPAEGCRAARDRAYAPPQSVCRRPARGTRGPRRSPSPRGSEVVLATHFGFDAVGGARDDTERELELLEVHRLELRAVSHHVDVAVEAERAEREVEIALQRLGRSEV